MQTRDWGSRRRPYLTGVYLIFTRYMLLPTHPQVPPTPSWRSRSRPRPSPGPHALCSVMCLRWSPTLHGPSFLWGPVARSPEGPQPPPSHRDWSLMAPSDIAYPHTNGLPHAQHTSFAPSSLVSRRKGSRRLRYTPFEHGPHTTETNTSHSPKWTSVTPSTPSTAPLFSRWLTSTYQA